MEREDVGAVADGLWRARSALRGLADAFATDDYALDVVSLHDRRLTIAIRALAGACEECLVPSHVIADLIRTQIPSDLSGCVIDVQLDVPAAWQCSV